MNPGFLPLPAKCHRSGFNLIEIAIVLAVIGLVIGGIYVAASAVTEKNRQQAQMKIMLQIVANVRAVYQSQNTFTALTNDQIRQIGIMPGDVAYDGTRFMGPYGEIALLPGITQTFVITMTNISRAGCIAILGQTMTSQIFKQNYGMAGMSVNGSVGPNGNHAADMPMSDLVETCNQGDKVSLSLAFKLRDTGSWGT